MKRTLIMAGSFCVGGLTAWIAWGPLKNYLFSFIPQAFEHAGLFKIGILIVIGYCGGIGLPLAIIIVGTVIALDY